jgi:nitric oxide reductase subunit B
MIVQEEVKIHFVVMLLCATLFTVGIAFYIYEFIKYGKPTDEALESENPFDEDNDKMSNQKNQAEAVS